MFDKKPLDGGSGKIGPAFDNKKNEPEKKEKELQLLNGVEKADWRAKP